MRKLRPPQGHIINVIEILQAGNSKCQEMLHAGNRWHVRCFQQKESQWKNKSDHKIVGRVGETQVWGLPGTAGVQVTLERRELWLAPTTAGGVTASHPVTRSVLAEHCKMPQPRQDGPSSFAFSKTYANKSHWQNLKHIQNSSCKGKSFTYQPL